jgi:hypothetical protein
MDARIMREVHLRALMGEAVEILAMVVTSIKTARSRC